MITEAPIGRAAGVAADATTLAIVPAFILTQWLAVRWDLPTRPVFNAAVLAVALVVVASGFRQVWEEHRIEVALMLFAAVVVAASVVVNWQSMSVAVRGSLPYLGVLVVAAAALVPRLDVGVTRRSLVVAAVAIGAVALAALTEQVLGRVGHVVLGQDLDYPRWWERGRATGLVANPGRLAQVGVLGVALSAAAAWPVAAVLAVAGGVSVGASVGRIGLVTVFGLGLVAIWVVVRHRTAWGLVAGALVAAVTVTAVLALVPAARDDFLGRQSATVGGDIDVRRLNLEATGRLLADFPVLGAGPGRFGSTTAWATHSELHERYGLPDVRSPEYAEQLQESGTGKEIDVGTAQLELGWAQIAAELGIVGLLAFAAVIAMLVARAVSQRRWASLALLLGLSALSLASPGIVDLALASTFLWWAGVLMGQRNAPSWSAST